LALAVPLSRFTSRVGGGSAFFVRPLTPIVSMRFETTASAPTRLLRRWLSRSQSDLCGDASQVLARTRKDSGLAIVELPGVGMVFSFRFYVVCKTEPVA
jgi:hypothetical protein